MRIYLQTPPESNDPPRFYQIWLQKDMVGGWTLVTESGQQGYSGRVRRKHYDSWEEAEKAVQNCRNRQINRGYTVVFVQGQDHP